MFANPTFSKLLRLINVQFWMIQHIKVTNPLFFDGTTLSFLKDTWESIVEGNKEVSVGLLGLISGLDTATGEISLVPVRQMWNMLGRFLTTFGGEGPLSFKTKDSDIVFTYGSKLPIHNSSIGDLTVDI